MALDVDRVRLDDEPIDDAPTSGDSRHRPTGTRRRLRQAAVVVGVATLAGAGGVVVGTRIKSPADAASERAAPTASLITVPIERRQLVSNLIVSGETQYVEPTTVRLAGNVGASGGERQVITRVPALDTEVAEGSVVFEVSGRPVFALRGELPMYRQLVPGSSGPDVLQLETALQALGFPPGAVDQLYDGATEAAVDAFYGSHGFASEGPNETQRTSLDDARKEVRAAEETLNKAKIDLAKGATETAQSELVAQQQALQAAEAAAPAARTKAERDNAEKAQVVATKQALADNARSTRDNARAALDLASAPGAVNPDTGEPPTPDELVTLQGVLIEAERALIEAQDAVAIAVSDQQNTAETGAKAISDADDALQVERLKYDEQRRPTDNTTLEQSVTTAEASLADANATLAAVEAEVGTIVPAGEIVFLPMLPTTVTGLTAQVGAQPPADALAQVSSTDTQIVGRIAKADAELLATGTPVTIEMRDVGISTTGVLAEIRAPRPAATSPTEQGEGGPAGGAQRSQSDLLEVVVTADDTSELRQYIGSPVRINVTVSSTGDEVLAVPVAAISVGPDGTSRVEVQRQAGSRSRQAVTEVVEVTVGLTAQGYAEIAPIAGATLAEGDRVVIGTSGDQRSSRRDRDGDDAAER